MEQQTHVRFAELLRLNLNDKIKKKFADGRTVNEAVLREIRDCVRETIASIFAKSSYSLSEKAVNWVSNQYFKSIQLGTPNGPILINELVVINDFPLSEMTFQDIQLMKNLFNDMDMSTALNEEYNRRNVS